ncbi:unnamed protein product [Leptosia nina]|uniref:Uncharacterized protein n=1 Tax=Leptosia nina TaxID=320188 RepID=A0AAV1JS66_9NEOP
MLGVGVGLGYNYCYVDFSSGRGPSAAFDENEDFMKMPANDTESDNSTDKGAETTTEAEFRKAFKPYTLPQMKNNVMVYVPLNAGVDFAQLLKKIRTKYQYRYKNQPTPHWRSLDSEDYYEDVDTPTLETYNSKEVDSLNTHNDIEITTRENNLLLTVNETTGMIPGFSVTEDKTEEGIVVTSNDSDTIEGKASKIVIPIDGLDLISLLSKWRAENRNYTLQVVVS